MWKCHFWMRRMTRWSVRLLDRVWWKFMFSRCRFTQSWKWDKKHTKFECYGRWCVDLACIEEKDEDWFRQGCRATCVRHRQHVGQKCLGMTCADSRIYGMESVWLHLWTGQRKAWWFLWRPRDGVVGLRFRRDRCGRCRELLHGLILWWDCTRSKMCAEADHCWYWEQIGTWHETGRGYLWLLVVWTWTQMWTHMPEHCALQTTSTHQRVWKMAHPHLSRYSTSSTQKLRGILFCATLCRTTLTWNK